MATSTASSTNSMTNGTMHSGMMMSMSEMMMVFFTSTGTPLYSNAWTPTSTGQYAGTCIFLIVLAVVMRGLIALRCSFEYLWDRSAGKQNVDALRRMPTNVKEDVAAPPTAGQRRPWRVNEAAARACLDVVLAGVSYLLMLAVMTMNVGYFMAVLGGVFLGSFILGGRVGGPVTH
ncbi:unnamed protein product [Zymoseptoria tritici ST99CH_3D7]|uniref:Copper transport protein n=3 Tax=Zymoseptoria tritici TaxID=1047171 RepID=A0A1X7S9C0_ZYMT9|nr:unnamed protein product [Zymoseptoria tritici ST99CH_3D7]